MELTEVFFDTNFLRRKNIDDFSIFHFGSQFEDFIDFLGTNDVVDYYKINISEITIEELKKQINDKYKEELLKLNESYNKFKRVHNIKLNVDENFKYHELLEKLLKEYLEFYNINTVEIKNLSLQNLLKRAINKNKPFIGENGILVHNRCKYRGGKYKPRAKDIAIDPETGLVQPTKGISVNTDPSKVQQFGKVSRVDSIPSELKFIKTGGPGHYEIVPKKAMTLERYQELLDQITIK